MDVTIVTDTKTYNVSLDRMTSLEDILKGQGIPCPFVCGGEGTCGKCRVKFLSNAPKPTAQESKLLGQRLIDRGRTLDIEHAGICIGIDLKGHGATVCRGEGGCRQSPTLFPAAGI